MIKKHSMEKRCIHISCGNYSSPKTLNQWEYEDSVESDLMSLYLDSLYTFLFNDEKMVML